VRLKNSGLPEDVALEVTSLPIAKQSQEIRPMGSFIVVLVANQHHIFLRRKQGTGIVRLVSF
jgi:hypothetical protein